MVESCSSCASDTYLEFYLIVQQCWAQTCLFVHLIVFILDYVHCFEAPVCMRVCVGVSDIIAFLRVGVLIYRFH